MYVKNKCTAFLTSLLLVVSFLHMCTNSSQSAPAVIYHRKRKNTSLPLTKWMPADVMTHSGLQTNTYSMWTNTRKQKDTLLTFILFCTMFQEIIKKSTQIFWNKQKWSEWSFSDQFKSNNSGAYLWLNEETAVREKAGACMKQQKENS